MGNMNRVQLAGFLGKDPEVKQVNGDTLATFRLATNYKFKTKAGEEKKIAEWHNIVAWGWLGDIVAEQFRKGSNVYVEGRLTPRHWETEQGYKRTKVEVTAFVLWSLAPSATKQQDTPPEEPGSEDGTPEHIPF